MVPIEATLYTYDWSIKWRIFQTNAREGIVLSHKDVTGGKGLSVAATVG